MKKPCCPYCGSELDDLCCTPNKYQCIYINCDHYEDTFTDDEVEWEDDDDFDISEYLDDDMPEGCKACGGPYPNCKSGCKVFDDD